MMIFSFIYILNGTEKEPNCTQKKDGCSKNATKILF